MSGFRNFGVEQYNAGVKTLHSNDDDDWRTEDDENTINQVSSHSATQAKQPIKPQDLSSFTVPVAAAAPSVDNGSARDAPQEQDWLASKMDKLNVNPIHSYSQSPSFNKINNVSASTPTAKGYQAPKVNAARPAMGDIASAAEPTANSPYNPFTSSAPVAAPAAVAPQVMPSSTVGSIQGKFNSSPVSNPIQRKVSGGGFNGMNQHQGAQFKLPSFNGTPTGTGIALKPHEEAKDNNGVDVLANTFIKQNQKTVIYGHSSDITHTINDDEKESFTNHINYELSGRPLLKAKAFPIDAQSMQLFDECKDGLILASLINDAVPNTIDERALNKPPTNGKSLSVFQMNENTNVVINSAKAIGCSVVNIGSEDIVAGRAHLILGLIWQILRIGVQSTVDIKVHPELYRLLLEGELLEDFLKLPVETILLRWFNYHLKNAGANRRVNNFNSDLMDSENYIILLNQLSPANCSLDLLRESDLHSRAANFLNAASRVDCNKYVTPKTIVEGNTKLNFLFVANLFNELPGLTKLSDSELEDIGDQMFDSEGDREARAFALWLNSLNVDPFVNYLFDDVRDGLVLLQAIDKVHPGMVNWKQVNRPKDATMPLSKFKSVENANYAVDLGKDQMKFSLVGIQGDDINVGNRTLTLALVWQLMREHIVQVIKSLSASQGGKPVSEEDMIRWSNSTVRRSGNVREIQGFRDESLSNSVYLGHLLNGIRPGCIEMNQIVVNGNEDDKLKNAMYVISIARKLGATIFVLPEDIVEVKPKMMLTFIGTLMSIDLIKN